MSYLSALVQRVLNQNFYDNTSVITQNVTETNLALIASLEYVQNYAQYYLQGIYMSINNPIFTGLMTGSNITINNELSAPTITSNTNFTGTPTVQNYPIQYDILGEIQIITTKVTPPNYLICDGSSYSTSDYSDLFNLIGYNYGGSGSNFNVPNFQSAFPIGANNSSINGLAISNFNSGNNATGANNNYSYFAGNSSPLLTTMPSHAHSSTNFVHQHGFSFSEDKNIYIYSEPEFMFPLTAFINTDQTTTNTTGVIVDDIGYNIQTIDPISGLSGVNICPPYISYNFCICYKATS